MSTIYLAIGDSLLVVTGSGETWESAERLSGLPTQCVAADPRQAGVLYCGTFGRGLWRSRDGGQTWEPAGRGIEAAAVMAVAVGWPVGSSVFGSVWAGTEPSALYRSDDGGATWQEKAGLRALPSRASWSFPPRPWTHHVRWIVPDPNQIGRLFVSIEAGGIMRTRDGGDTWEDRKPSGPLDAHTVRAHPLAPGRLYAACGDGYHESYDAGETWRRLEEGLRHHYLWSVAVDPGDANTVVISAARGPREAHDARSARATVYRRSAGSDWQEVTRGLPEPEGTTAAVLATGEAEPGVFYLADNRGLFRSVDGGNSWRQLAIPWPERFRERRVDGLLVST